MSDEIRGPVPLSDRPPPQPAPTPSRAPNLTAAPTPPRRRFRIRFPLTVLILTALIFFSPVLWALGWETAGQEPPFPMWFGVSLFAVPLAVVLLVVWWLFFAAVGWGTRLLVFALAAVLLGGFIGSVRRVDFTMPVPNVIWPRFYMAWDQLPDQRRANFHTEEVDKQQTIDLTIGPEDFARYRGPDADGVSKGPALETDWKAHPPKIVWQHPSGDGYSGFAVAGNVVVTLEQFPSKESIVCYDRSTGRQRWAHTYDAYHKDVMGDGPRGTPLIADGFVYSLGAAGDLVRVDGATGEKSWAINVLSDCKAKKPQWGLSGSPLLVGDHIIIDAGVDPEHPEDKAVAAYDCKTGKRVWASGKRKAGYSSPQLATLAGKPQILLFDGEGLGGFDPADGNELWFYEWKTFQEMNDTQPLVIGDDGVFISSEGTNGCALVRVHPPKGDKGWTTETAWSNKDFASKFANPVVYKDHIYGLSNGYLFCLDAATGEKKWKLLGRYGMGQVLRRGETLVVTTDGGAVALVAADAKAGRELARLPVLSGKTWNTPALAGEQLFLRNQSDMACVQLPVVKK